VSPKQQEWLTELEQRGWVARVCYGSEEAIALIESYMSGPLPTLTGADAVTGHTSAP